LKSWCMHCREDMLKEYVEIKMASTTRVFRCDFCGFQVRVDN